MNANQLDKDVIAKTFHAIGVDESTDVKLSAAQERLRNAAPMYLTEPQLNTLLVAGERGWTGRSIVTNVKLRVAAVSIARGTAIAWVLPDGSIEGEEFLVKGMLH